MNKDRVKEILNTWSADWIWLPMCARQKDNEHIYLRKRVLTSDKPIKTVIAFISADDNYKFYLNGQLMGQGPAPSYPDRRQNYNVLNLTSAWKTDGPNILGARAFYSGMKNWAFVSGDDRRGFIMETHVSYVDGSTDIIKSNESWKVKRLDAYSGRHVFGYNLCYNEDLDARLLEPRWLEDDYDDSAWDYAEKQPPELWMLKPQITEMVQSYERSPQSVTVKGPHRWVVDFGLEIVGGLNVAVHGDGKSRLDIRVGEEKNADGTPVFTTRAKCEYQDYWVTREGFQVLSHNDYRAFRYAEVIAENEVLKIDNVSATVRHYPFDDAAASFDSSCEKLNALWDLCKYSIKMGTQDIYMDCPTREKANYPLDSLMQMSAAIYVGGDSRVARDALELFLASADDGKLTYTAPGSPACRHYFTEYTMYPVIMAWRYYLYTADLEFLQQNYQSLCRVESYMRETFANADGLLVGTDAVLRDLVDWPQEFRDNHDIRSVNIAVNSVYHELSRSMENIAMALKKHDDAKTFKARARTTCDAINHHLWNPTTRRYVDGMNADYSPSTNSSLHANVFPLAMDVVPESRVRDVTAFIKRRGPRCNLFLGIFFYEALFDNGEAEYALKLMTSTDDPRSPYNWCVKGATTTWERWDCEGVKHMTFFHPAGAFVAYIIASRVIGVKPLEPGFKTYAVTPCQGHPRRATLRFQTPGGEINATIDAPPKN